MQPPYLSHAVIGGMFRTAVDHLRRTYPRKPQEEIEDAAAEAVCRYLEHCNHAMVPIRMPDAWIRVTALNQIRSEFRKRRRYVYCGNSDDVDHVSGYSTCIATDSVENYASQHLTMQILSPLGGRTMNILWLHDIEGWKPEDIAREQNCSTNAVYMVIKRGHKELRKVMIRS